MSLVNLKKNNVMRPPFDSIFDNFMHGDLWTGFATGTTVPAVNIKETNDKYEVQVASPGLKKEDFNIDVDNNVLTISSEKKEEKEEKEEKKGEHITRKEFSFSSFKRSFSIPENVDVSKIDAAYKDGILTLALPKKEKKAEETKKKIAIG
jgi:HSP20 family protein